MSAPTFPLGEADEGAERERIDATEQRLRFYRGRLPDLWPDREVRRFMIAARGFVTIKVARQQVAAIDPVRAPSTSAICRFWNLIDELERQR